MRELLRHADALGIESDTIEKGRRLNAQTVVRMDRRRDLAQLATSTDLEELETQVRPYIAWHRSPSPPLPPRTELPLRRLTGPKTRACRTPPSFLTSTGS